MARTSPWSWGLMGSSPVIWCSTLNRCPPEASIQVRIRGTAGFPILMISWWAGCPAALLEFERKTVFLSH